MPVTARRYCFCRKRIFPFAISACRRSARTGLNALQQIALFNHLVGEREQRWRNRYPKRFCRLQN